MQVKKQKLESDMEQDWFQIGNGVRQGCYVVSLLFNVYSEYIMRNAGLDEAQLESRLLEEISRTSDMQMTPPLWQKEKEMATHSSTLAWKIPWTEKPGGLQSMGSQRVGHDWVTSLSLMAESEELKSLLMEVKEESEKAGLKLNIQKTKIMASGPIISWQIDGETMKRWESLFWGAPKSLQMMKSLQPWN